MNLDKYLKKNKLSVQKFAYEADIAATTVYKILKGIKITKHIARVIEEYTDGEVLASELMKDDGY